MGLAETTNVCFNLVQVKASGQRVTGIHEYIYIKKHLFTWDDCTFTHIYLQTDDLL